MIQSRFPAVVAMVVLVGGSPAVIYGNCSVVPHDGIAENGFGASPGFSIEYCGLIQPPPECTIDGWYFPVTQGTSFTRTGGQTTLTYTSVIREAVDAPLAEGAEPFPGQPLVTIQPISSTSRRTRTRRSPMCRLICNRSSHRISRVPCLMEISLPAFSCSRIVLRRRR